MNKIFIVLFILLNFVNLAIADNIQFEIGAGMAYFGGLQYKSLAPKTGTMLRFGAGTGRKNTFKWVSHFTLLNSSGETYFDDNATYRKLTYKMLAGEFNIGFKLAFLAPLEKCPIQPYFGAAGSIMSASFQFDETATVSDTFPKTDAQNFYGYAIFVGADVDIGREWGANIHVEQSKVSGTLANKSFVLDSNRVFLQVFVRY